MEEIVSLDNQKVVFWSKLNNKKYRNDNQMFIIEGEHLILEALKTQNLKEIITTNDKIYDDNIPHYKVSDKIMKKISSLTTPSAVIGICSFLKELDLTDKVLVLDGIQDPGNLGTMIRSALAFGFNSIVLGSNTVDIYNEKVLRATEGMLFHLNIIKRNLISFIPKIQSNGYVVIGTDVNAGISPKKINCTKLALIIGNEGAGMQKDIASLCDKLVNINISDKCESLNASVAASILMYELGGQNG